MSDRIAVMRNGRLVQVDTPRRLHDFPADDFVASFIGESTLVGVERAGPDAVKLAGTVLRTARQVPQDGTIFLAVQSEKLLLDDGTLGNDWNRISGTISDVVFQGESLKVFVTLSNGEVIGFRQASHHEGNLRLPGIGATVTLGLHPQDTIVVPKAA